MPEFRQRCGGERHFPSGGRVYCLVEPSPQRHPTMTSQGTARGRFQRAIHARHLQNAEMAAREMGGLSLADALLLCALLAKADPKRHERAAPSVASTFY